MLIAIEGLDGSGKHTQTEMLFNYLKETKGVENVLGITYPKYNSACSVGVRKFLKGDFGTNVDPYTISTLYAIDRFADYTENWGKIYKEGVYVVADRYVQSNMIYQLARLPKTEWENYLKWLEDLEFVHNELPRADLVIFLSVPVEVSQKLMAERYKGDESKKDINERNIEYLKQCEAVVQYLIDKKGWKVVQCEKDGVLRDKEDIAEEIKAIVKYKEKVDNFKINMRF